MSNFIERKMQNSFLFVEFIAIKKSNPGKRWKCYKTWRKIELTNEKFEILAMFGRYYEKFFGFSEGCAVVSTTFLDYRGSTVL